MALAYFFYFSRKIKQGENKTETPSVSLRATYFAVNIRKHLWFCGSALISGVKW
jgi:hypothetical protein